MHLSINQPDEAPWAAYILEIADRVGPDIQEPVKAGNVTKVSIDDLEPGTPYRVRVRPVKDKTEPKVWIDEATFDTPGEAHTGSIINAPQLVSTTRLDVGVLYVNPFPHLWKSCSLNDRHFVFLGNQSSCGLTTFGKSRPWCTSSPETAPTGPTTRSNSSPTTTRACSTKTYDQETPPRST